VPQCACSSLLWFLGCVKRQRSREEGGSEISLHSVPRHLRDPMMISAAFM